MVSAGRDRRAQRDLARRRRRGDRIMTAPIVASEVRRTVLPNGLVCLVKSSGESGAVAIHGFVKAGAALDAGRSGLARFVGSTLLRGTHRRSGPQIAEDLDGMGASLSVGAGIETTVFL